MRRTFVALVVCGALGTGLVASQALAISETQAKVQEFFKHFGFKMLPPPEKVLGAPTKFKVTKEALEKLKKAMEEEKTIVIEADGKIKVE